MKIARIFGIDLVIHFSWILIFPLVTMSISNIYAGIFPSMNTVTHWIWAAALALIIYVSLLLHEFAHCALGYFHGVRTKHIVLFVFGAFARFERAMPTPATEMQVAVAGPLMSLILGIGGLVAGRGAADALTPLLLFSSIFGFMNLAIAIFNMLPAYPMDGGRVLRSMIWKLTGHKHFATMRSAEVSIGIGVLIQCWGIYTLLFRTGSLDLNGAWLIVVGMFMTKLALDERRHAQHTQLAIQTLRGMKPTTFPFIEDEIRRLELQ